MSSLTILIELQQMNADLLAKTLAELKRTEDLISQYQEIIRDMRAQEEKKESSR